MALPPSSSWSQDRGHPCLSLRDREYPADPRLFAASRVPEGVYLTGQVAGLTVTLAGSHACSVSASHQLCFHPLLLTQ